MNFEKGKDTHEFSENLEVRGKKNPTFFVGKIFIIVWFLKLDKIQKYIL